MEELNYGTVRILQNSSSFRSRALDLKTDGCCHERYFPVRPTEVSRQYYSLATLRGILVIWDERIRLRREVEQKSRDNPHLIDDIGLTTRQVEAKIAKPFWQA